MNSWDPAWDEWLRDAVGVGVLAVALCVFGWFAFGEQDNVDSAVAAAIWGE